MALSIKLPKVSCSAAAAILMGLGFDTRGWLEIEIESEGEMSSTGEEEDLERKSFDSRLLDFEAAGATDAGEDVPHVAGEDMSGVRRC